MVLTQQKAPAEPGEFRKRAENTDQSPIRQPVVFTLVFHPARPVPGTAFPSRKGQIRQYLEGLRSQAKTEDGDQRNSTD